MDEEEDDDGEPERPGSIPWTRTTRAARRIFSPASIYSTEILAATMHGDGDGDGSMAACGELGFSFGGKSGRMGGGERESVVALSLPTGTTTPRYYRLKPGSSR